jgi:hypothetical protein
MNAWPTQNRFPLSPELDEPLAVPELATYTEAGHEKPVGQLTVRQLRDAARLARQRQHADADVLHRLLGMAEQAGQLDHLPVNAILDFRERSVVEVRGWRAGPRAFNSGDVR